MKKTHFLMIVAVFFIVGSQKICAQSNDSLLLQEIESLKARVEQNKPGKSIFMLRGYAHSGFVKTDDQVSFDGGSFNPLLMFKQSDRLLFESELEMELASDGLEINLEYANISYILTQTLTLRAGKFLTPFGIFVPRLHPAWINKFPTKPLGTGHSGILPTADIGVELRGGAYLGPLKVNYSLYAINGPVLNNGADEPEEGGKLHYGRFPDNNNGKSIGGRLGILPFPNSSLEVGFSGMYGLVGKDSAYANTAATLYAIDASFVKSLSAIGSVIDFKGQYAAVMVGDAQYPDHENPDELISFTNNSSTYFAQFSIRPALISTPVIRNLEFASRYSHIQTPKGSEWEVNQNQWEFSVNYWIDWRTVVKISYRSIQGEEGHEEGEEEGHGIGEGNGLFIHWAIGF